MVILNRKNGDFINIGANKDGGVRYNKSVVETGEQLHKIGDVTNNPVGKLWLKLIEPEGTKIWMIWMVLSVAQDPVQFLVRPGSLSDLDPRSFGASRSSYKDKW